VTRHSADAGWAEPLFYETTVDELGDGLAREAIAAGADAVLVAGGDGTVRAVSEAMAGVEVPLTIVPSGTATCSPATSSFPFRSRRHDRGDLRGRCPRDRCGVRGAGAPRRTAGGACVRRDGRHGSGCRHDRQHQRRSEEEGRVGRLRRRRRPLAREGQTLRHHVPGRRPPDAPRTRAERALRQLRLAAGRSGADPEASVADGQLDIAIFQPKTAFGWLAVWRRVAWDNSVLRRFRAGRRILRLRTRDNSIRYARGTGIQIAAGVATPVQLDGDEFGEATAVDVRIHAGALRLAVPTGHTSPAL
jgi:hypothetical protein